MQKYALGLYLLLSLSVTSVDALSRLKLSVQSYQDIYDGYEITISTAAFAQVVTNAVNRVEGTYNVEKDTHWFRRLFDFDDIRFTVIINGVSYPDVRCRLQISVPEQVFYLINCGSDDIVFQNTFISLPYESIIVGRIPMAVE